MDRSTSSRRPWETIGVPGGGNYAYPQWTDERDERPYMNRAVGYERSRPDASLPTKVVINVVFLVALVAGLLMEARWIKRGILKVLRRVL